jgi:hypothetical protein
MKKEEVPECCKGCLSYEKFGKNCWIYWEHKKECTQNTSKVQGFVY